MTALHSAALFSVFIANWKCSLTMQMFSSGFWLCKVPALIEMFTGARIQTHGVQKLHEISVHSDVRDFNSSAHKAYPKIN